MANKKVGSGKAFNRANIKIAMEGDSWFRLPNFPFKFATVGGSDFDIDRGLRALGYQTHNAAHWGETIETMAQVRDYLNALSGWKPDVFFLSGGGNDLLGQKSGAQGRLVDYINQRPSGPHNKPASWFVRPEFDQDVARIVSFYRVIFDDVLSRKEYKNLKIVIHGYDYPVPKGLLWISEPFRFRNIEEPLRKQIIKVAIDRLNIAFKKLAGEYSSNVSYVNLRGIVQTEWHDELHPTRVGFERICAKIDATIEGLL